LPNRRNSATVSKRCAADVTLLGEVRADEPRLLRRRLQVPRRAEGAEPVGVVRRDAARRVTRRRDRSIRAAGNRPDARAGEGPTCLTVPSGSLRIGDGARRSPIHPIHRHGGVEAAAGRRKGERSIAVRDRMTS
jgi:hypothetical protein